MPNKTIYIDTFSGLIPVKLLSIEESDAGIKQIKVKLKRSKGPFKTGEVLTRPLCWVVYKIRQTKFRTYVRSLSIDEIKENLPKKEI